MKRTILLALLVATSMSVQPVLVQAATPVEKTAQTGKSPDIAEFDRQVAKVNESLKEMDALMDKIQKTQNSQERQQLLQQYWAAMQGAMGVMHGMWGPSGLGCCAGPGMGPGMMGGTGMGCCMAGGGPMMGWQNMHQYYSNLTPEQQKQRQYMTDQYMRMQQLMMRHMMQHQYWLNQPQPQPPAK